MLMTPVSIDRCPKEYRSAWQGICFYESEDGSYGICDDSKLTRLLGFTYLHELRNALEFNGPFTLIEDK